MKLAKKLGITASIAAGAMMTVSVASACCPGIIGSDSGD